MALKTEGLVDRHFSLGSLVNLVVLVTAIVAVTLYISDGRATAGTLAERVSAVEARQDRDAADTTRRLERIEDKLDQILMQGKP